MMKRTSLIFVLVLALLMTMLPMQAMAAAGEGVTPEDGDISIEIPSTPNTPAVYTVVFKDADGTVLSMQNYNYGDAVVAPEAPAKEADETYTYEFAGWNKEVTNCVGNAVYTATYTQAYVEYTVIFKAEDGTVIAEQTYHYGDTVVAPEAPEKPADAQNTYAFAGWTPTVEAVTGNAEYTATYTANAVEYTVVFKNWDGTVIAEQTYAYGAEVIAPAAPTKAEDDKYTYEFAGWTPTIENVTGNAEYTATFTATEKAPAVENAIIAQPQSVNAETGTDVQFHVEVEGDVVSYKWEYRKVSKWYNTTMTGYNTDTLTVGAKGSRHKYDYRCTITFADGTVLVSEPAELTVNTYINITSNPSDQTVVNGYKGQFTVKAEGEDLKYRWYYQRPDGTIWMETDMEGNTKQTVMIESAGFRNGYKYKCKITDAAGVETWSEVATMRVLTVTEHPAEAFALNGTKVTFTIETSVPDGFTYQWQYSKNGGESWSNTSMTGYNTATLTVDANMSRNGYLYRCELTGSKSSKLQSKAAVLHCGDALTIIEQPTDVTAAASENAVFHVEVANAYSFQWKYNKSGTTWSNTSAEGFNTDTLTVAAKGKNGYKYRCHIKGLDGTEIVTNEVTLTVG